MSKKIYNRFKTMGYRLVCKICDCPILPYDEVESKASGNGPKLYHKECYENFHLKFEYTEDKLHNIVDDYGKDELQYIFWEFDEEYPEGLSIDVLIDEILNLQVDWEKNHNP